ncbi:Uma2 family endonuclease [Nocardia sp. NPDC051570]|uniref:Uma2 family endonuclease n=1 Tax=Nocardia sp. NPDC051570 TaxID=3364324 RepID=UPI0037BD2A8D
MAYPVHRHLTIADYAALDEDDRARWELVEGNLVMSPSLSPRHARVSKRLLIQLDPQIPAGYELLDDIDVDLQLAPVDDPGSARRPDLFVVDSAEFDRVDKVGGILRASSVLLAIEIVSKGSRRTDYVTKRGEYADAGIPHYWIVDLNEPVSLLACHLAGEMGYVDNGEHTGVFITNAPFDMRLDLDALVR